MSQDELKRSVAAAALKYVVEDGIIGIGTGSTTNFFIEQLAKIKQNIDATVASSEATKHLLQELKIPVIDLNVAPRIDVYIDGADETTACRELIKGGGGALTREKIIAAVANKFVCMVDQTKQVSRLGGFAVPVEVIPMARSYVARELVKLGGDPEYRADFITDNGNIILDVHNLTITQPQALEEKINNITGVVTNGIFAKRPADILLVAKEIGEVVVLE